MAPSETYLYGGKPAATRDILDHSPQVLGLKKVETT